MPRNSNAKKQTSSRPQALKPVVWLKLSLLGLQTILANRLLHRPRPVVGSIIVTDCCNLACRHCAVANQKCILYPFARIQADMLTLYRAGVRVLLFYGGEPFLWRDGARDLQDLVSEARRIGFWLVSVVTNGTLGLDLPTADLILVSVDGTRANHNEIRGETFDIIMANIRQAPANNICLYMAINQINIADIEAVCALTRSMPHVRAVSFNFHTPYPGTEMLQLSQADKQACCDRISGLIASGYPVLNLKSAFPAIIHNSLQQPCPHCLIMENGQQWICGRCIEIDGLCKNCGFFFATELSLVFRGQIRVLLDLLQTYSRLLGRSE